MSAAFVLLTQLDGDVDAEVRVVIYHARVVIPEEEDRTLDVLQHPARQPQRRSRLQILLRRARNVGFRFGHAELHEQRNARMRRDGTLVEAGVAELDELDVELPILGRAEQES